MKWWEEPLPRHEAGALLVLLAAILVGVFL